MAGYQSFSLNAVEKAQSSSAAPYREFLRRPGFSMGMYLLPAGSQDAQHPHSADEVYIIQHGRAQLEVEGETIDVGPGDVISVDRGRDHHFLNISEDLAVLVTFAPPDDPQA
jgi:mannose-6-phosphate isomerase-like protein (cupin superfamily)